MTILKNTETGEIVELSIIDPKTGCDWSNDLIGNTGHGMATPNDVEDCEIDYLATQDDVDFWTNYFDAYQRTDVDLFLLSREVDENDWHKLQQDVMDINAEFNDYPQALQELLNRWQNEILTKSQKRATNKER